MNIENNNAHPQEHTMVLVNTHDSGAEEWYCPTCGRRFLMHWPPDYKKTVLEAGDETATHSGGKGGVSMLPPQVMRNQPDEIIDPLETLESQIQDVEDAPGLENWAELLDKIDFESWWKTPLK